jgi:hypothetical protein
MSPELAAALNAILSVLCDIRSVLRLCCEQGSCVPTRTPTAGTRIFTIALSTTPLRVLGINNNRIALIVGNALGTVNVFLAPRPNLSGSGGGTVIVSGGSVKTVSSYDHPTSVTGEWYAWSASGTPTITIQEELSAGGS